MGNFKKNDFVAGKFIISEKYNLAKNIYDFRIICPEVSKTAQAGQFVHIRIDEFMLRRPISICEIDANSETIRIVFEVRGEGTAVLGSFREGEFLDMLAPLGNGFTLPKKNEKKKALIIGGGIGTPPLLELAKSYGKSAKCLMGFRTAGQVILEEDFKAICETIVFTEDGSRGEKGYVTSRLEQMIKDYEPSIIYSCGPGGMLKAVAGLAKEHNIPCEVSLEERMACGVGACLVCACKSVKDGGEYYAHVCKDGPVFSSDKVVLV